MRHFRRDTALVWHLVCKPKIVQVILAWLLRTRPLAKKLSPTRVDLGLVSK